MTYALIRGRVALVAGLLVMTLAGWGSAEPEPNAQEPEPVRAVDIAAGLQDEPVDVKVDGGPQGVQVTFREITIEPGASTGEHCHCGQLMAVVDKGELTHYADNHPGDVRVYETGESITEGADYIHQGVNEGDVDVVLMVSYMTPEGKPLAEAHLARCND